MHIFLNSRGLEKTPENKTMMAYVVEDQNVGNLGRDIVFFASKLHPQGTIHILRHHLWKSVCS